VLDRPDSAAGQAFGAIADTLAARQRSLVGRPLGLSVAAR
jgi:hypothetical protein